jgi:isopenicillin-N N-acyltransferase-like protein
MSPRGPLRILRLSGDARARGEAHGAAFGPAIAAYAEDRWALASDGSWTGGRAVPLARLRSLAREMIPAHRAYAPEIQDELDAIAVGAGLAVDDLLVTSGFTDFVDAARALGGAPAPDGCTSVLVPRHRGEGGRAMYAQTWDMHGSATDHVVLLDIRPTDGPRALVFTTTGCVGQIGLNEAGIGIGIDNLSCTDGRPGVCWPHVVRKVLLQRTWDDALRALREVDLAGGHAYHLIDGQGHGLMVERTSTRGHEWPLDVEVLVHTNHALAPSVREVEAVRAEALVRSSHERYARARQRTAEGTLGPMELMGLCQDGSICRVALGPHDVDTSGAVVLDPERLELWAVWGDPRAGQWQRFDLRP